MKKYNYSDYNFIGTAKEFAKRYGKYKGTTFVNAVQALSRHNYNRMDAVKQREYDKKRERAKISYRLFLDDQLSESYELTKEEYKVIDLPVRNRDCGVYKLRYRNREIPYSFIGNKQDEIPVSAAMKKYLREAVVFAEQVMLATGYFNTQHAVRKPHIHINYTSLTLTYDDGIEFLFNSEKSLEGVQNCYLFLVQRNKETIYNGHRRLRTVDDVMRFMEHNKDCMNADYYL